MKKFTFLILTAMIFSCNNSINKKNSESEEYTDIIGVFERAIVVKANKMVRKDLNISFPK